MKFVKQFLIILGISFAGEALKFLLPLPIPASIYGMVILLIGLLSGLVPLSSVKEAGTFLIEIMPVMFIPAGVGLMASWHILQPVLIPVSLITVAALITVMIASGRCTQWILHRNRNRKKASTND